MCAGLALLLYLVGLGRPPLWEPDEGRYAEIAREMVVGHDYITPRNNFVRYLEKPPLVYCAICDPGPRARLLFDSRDGVLLHWRAIVSSSWRN